MLPSCLTTGQLLVQLNSLNMKGRVRAPYLLCIMLQSRRLNSINVFEWQDQDWADVNNAPCLNIACCDNSSACDWHQTNDRDVNVSSMRTFWCIQDHCQIWRSSQRDFLASNPFGMKCSLIFRMQMHDRPGEIPFDPSKNYCCDVRDCARNSTRQDTK